MNKDGKLRVQFLAKRNEEVAQLEIVQGEFSDIEIISELSRLFREGYTLEKVSA